MTAELLGLLAQERGPADLTGTRGKRTRGSSPIRRTPGYRVTAAGPAWKLRPARRSSFHDQVDFHASSQRQAGDRDRRAGGEWLGEMPGVDAIECSEVAHVGEEYSGADDVIEAPPRGLEDCREIPEDALRLGHDTAFDELPRGRVLPGLATHVEEAIDPDRCGVRAHWRGKLRGADCCLDHLEALYAVIGDAGTAGRIMINVRL